MERCIRPLHSSLSQRRQVCHCDTEFIPGCRGPAWFTDRRAGVFGHDNLPGKTTRLDLLQGGWRAGGSDRSGVRAAQGENRTRFSLRSSIYPNALRYDYKYIDNLVFPVLGCAAGFT